MIAKSIKPVAVILIFTAILNIFYTKGKYENGDSLVFTVLGRFEVWDKGLYTALFTMLRIISLVIISSLLTYTTTPTMLTDGLEKLLSPLKKLHIRVDTLAMMMTLALRFIPTLIEETDRIISAQKSRGADLDSGGLVKRAKALLPILVPLFVSAFRRADELAVAMESRCYHGGEGRTRMKQLKFALRDYVTLVLFGLFLAAIIAMRKIGT